MIAKLICFIFGHKRTWNCFTGEYGKEQEFDSLSRIFIYPPIYIEKNYKICPRCGIDLTPKRGKQ